MQNASSSKTDISEENNSLRLRESIIKEAIKNMSWSSLETHFNEININALVFIEFSGHLQRSSGLIFPYPSKSKEKQRSNFFEKIKNYAFERLGNDSHILITAVITILLKSEQGYRGILSLLDNSDISKISPEKRVSAYIYRAYSQYFFMTERLQEVFNQKDYKLPHGPLPAGDNGELVNPDGVISSLVNALSITLVMEAYKNNWFDENECLVLPNISSANEEEMYKAGSTEVLAQSWKKWRETEERLRFLNGALEESDRKIPNWNNKVTHYILDEESEVWDYIANERLHDRLIQTFMEMTIEYNLTKVNVDQKEYIPLLPDSFVNVEEAHAAVSLSEVLSYSIIDDIDLLGGLRFVEWVRGYAVLKKIVTEQITNLDISKLEPYYLESNKLLSILERHGLSTHASSYFINAATLSTSSRDLFDCPLIKMADGNIAIFSPALLDANIAKVVLSIVSNFNEPLARKGKAFEEDILSFLLNKNLNAKSIKVIRENAEYQYDILLVWGDYVFLFECKNHGLSNHHPVQAYYFGMQVNSDIKQVKRLAAALEKYPDIMMQNFGVNIADKKIISCVLNALPYSRINAVDDVYLFDASSLKRFFQERNFNIKNLHQLNGNMKIIHRIPIRSFWKDEKPSASDLLEHIKSPLQVELMITHMEVNMIPFLIAKDEMVITESFMRKELSITSISEFLNIKATTVHEEISEISNIIEEVRKSN